MSNQVINKIQKLSEMLQKLTSLLGKEFERCVEFTKGIKYCIEAEIHDIPIVEVYLINEKFREVREMIVVTPHKINIYSLFNEEIDVVEKLLEGV